jgi:hypothetical protein
MAFWNNEEDDETRRRGDDQGGSFWSFLKTIGVMLVAALAIVTGLALFNNKTANWIDAKTKGDDGQGLATRARGLVGLTPPTPPAPPSVSETLSEGASTAAGTLARGAAYTMGGAAVINAGAAAGSKIFGKGELAWHGNGALLGSARTAPLRAPVAAAGMVKGAIDGVRNGAPEPRTIPTNDMFVTPPEGATRLGIEAMKDGKPGHYKYRLGAVLDGYEPTRVAYRTAEGKIVYTPLEPGVFTRNATAAQSGVASAINGTKQVAATTAGFVRDLPANTRIMLTPDYPNRVIAKAWVEDYLDFATDPKEVNATNLPLETQTQIIETGKTLKADPTAREALIRKTAQEISNYTASTGNAPDKMPLNTVSNIAIEQRGASPVPPRAPASDTPETPKAAPEAGGSDAAPKPDDPTTARPPRTDGLDKNALKTEGAKKPPATGTAVMDPPSGERTNLGALPPDEGYVKVTTVVNDGQPMIVSEFFDAGGKPIPASKAPAAHREFAHAQSSKLQSTSIKTGAAAGAVALAGAAIVFFNPEANSFEKWSAGTSGVLGAAATASEFAPQIANALRSVSDKTGAMASFSQKAGELAPGLAKAAAPVGAVAGIIAAPLLVSTSIDQFRRGEYVEGTFSAANAFVGGTAAVVGGAATVGTYGGAVGLGSGVTGGATATAVVLAPVAAWGAVVVGGAYIGYGLVKGGYDTYKTASDYNAIDQSFQPDQTRFSNVAGATAMLTNSGNRAGAPAELKWVRGIADFGGERSADGKFDMTNPKNQTAFREAINTRMSEIDSWISKNEYSGWNPLGWFSNRYVQLHGSERVQNIEAQRVERRQLASALEEFDGAMTNATERKNAAIAAAQQRDAQMRAAQAQAAQPAQPATNPVGTTVAAAPASAPMTPATMNPHAKNLQRLGS